MSSGDGKAARLKVSFKSTNLRGEGCGTRRRWHKPALSKLKPSTSKPPDPLTPVSLQVSHRGPL